MSFTQILLQWFRENGRSLPWRETKDPYAIWLSEIILQQTQVKQGWAYWERFMQRWPTVDALAAATEDEVLREWQGLGYYSRARNLHFAARQIVAMGGFPTTLEGIRSLKGVGDYTAAAIGSIAYDLPAAVVDGNVQGAQSLFRHRYAYQQHGGQEGICCISPEPLAIGGWERCRSVQSGHHGLWRYTVHTRFAPLLALSLAGRMRRFARGSDRRTACKAEDAEGERAPSHLCLY